MADSVFTPTVTNHYSLGKWDLIIGTLATTASTYTAGGAVLSFATSPEIKSNKVPVYMDIQGIAGFVYRYVPGATKDVGKVMIFQCAGAATPMVEETAVDAAVAADTIRFMALFPLLR